MKSFFLILKRIFYYGFLLSLNRRKVTFTSQCCKCLFCKYDFDIYLFESWVHESPHIHGRHFSVIISIVQENPVEHVTDHADGEQLHPLGHLLDQLLLLLGQAHKTSAYWILALRSGFPDQDINVVLFSTLNQ